MSSPVADSHQHGINIRVVAPYRFDQFPLLIAYAISAKEVGPLIKCAKAAGVKAVPRNGGHQ
jgi:FAD/FMN-containing dehydrogenase